MEINDNLIVKKVLEGDKEAFGELINKYSEKVYNLILRMINNSEEAKDISQKVFLRAYSYLYSFNPKQKFLTWLLRIAMNLSYDYLKKKKGQSFISFEELDFKTLQSLTQDLPKLDIETEKLIQNEIYNLKEKYEVVILLKYVDGLNYEEISDILNVSVGVVKMRIKRAKSILYKRLKPYIEGGEKDGML